VTPAVIVALRRFAAAASALAEALETSEPYLPPEVAAFVPEDPLERLFLGATLIWKVTPEQLRGTTKAQHIVHVRHAVAFILRTRFEWSYPRIGAALNRDHTTIMDACNNVTEKWSIEMHVNVIDQLTGFLDGAES
jgi:hypothetical protein